MKITMEVGAPLPQATSWDLGHPSAGSATRSAVASVTPSIAAASIATVRRRSCAVRGCHALVAPSLVRADEPRLGVPRPWGPTVARSCPHSSWTPSCAVIASPAAPGAP